MSLRLPVFFVLCLCLGAATAQTAEPQVLQSIGAGPFEIPIAGTFNVTREQGATLFRAVDGGREIRVAYFRNAAAASNAEQIARVEAQIRGNWERFAARESFVVVRPFARAVLGPTLVALTMASQHGPASAPQYYVQYAVTDGAQIMSLIVEGFGKADAVADELSPLVLRAKMNTVDSPPAGASAPATRP